MNSSRGIIHAYARCFDCEWVSQNKDIGRALAIRHARVNRHYTVCDEGHVFWFDARERGETKPPLEVKEKI